MVIPFNCLWIAMYIGVGWVDFGLWFVKLDVDCSWLIVLLDY